MTIRLLLILHFFSITIEAQQTKEDSIVLKSLKDMFLARPESVHPFLEIDTTTVEKWNKQKVSTTKWEKKFTKNSLKELEKSINTNAEFKLAKVWASDKKPYHEINVSFDFEDHFYREFLKIKFHPDEITLAGESITIYPDDRGRINNESGSIMSFAGINKFSQNVAIGIDHKEKISGILRVKGEFKIEIIEQKNKYELEKGVIKEIGEEQFELIEIKGDKAFVITKNNKGISDLELKCKDNEGLKSCSVIFSIPKKLFDYYYRGEENFKLSEYEDLVHSLTSSELENGLWVKMIDTSLPQLEKVVVFENTGQVFEIKVAMDKTFEAK